MFGDNLRQSSERDDTVWAGTADLQGTVLVSLLAIALLVAPIDTPLFVRVLVAVPLFCFLPGYAILAALFPAAPWRESPDAGRPTNAPATLDRLALSVAVSLAAVPLVGTVGNSFWGIAVQPTLIAIGVLTIVASLFAIVRRARLPLQQRFDPLTSLRPLPSSLPVSGSSRFLLVAAVLGVAIAGVSVGYAATSSDAPTMEFYLTNESDGAVALDTETSPSDTQNVVIDRDASDSQTYTVVVRQYTSGGDAAEITRETVSVDGDERVAVTVPGGTADATRVEYLLYRGTPPEDVDPDDAVRHLWVTPNGSEA